MRQNMGIKVDADILSNIDNLLNSSFKAISSNELKEVQADMTLPIERFGCRHLLYSFDKGDNNSLLPFFASQQGVKSMCDYVMFCSCNSEFYILLVELKTGKEQKKPQLLAGKCLVKYIIDTYNRVYATNIAPKIRLIGISEKFFIKKGGTKTKAVVYDSDGYVNFEGNAFCIREFLK